MLIVVSAVAAVLGSVGGGTWWYANRAFDSIPTFESIAAPPAPGAIPAAAAAPVTALPSDTTGPTTTTPAPPVVPGVESYLVFSTGSQGLSDEDAATYRIGSDRAEHADGLTDTIMLVAVDRASSETVVVSIPRDTWIPSRGTRINSVYSRHGPAAFAGDVASLTGITPDHMIALNFAAFGQLTDAVGGVELWVPGPARDRYSGFVSDAEGCRLLGGADALALVRSRHWEVPNGRGGWRADASASDFGRIARQHQFLRAVVDELATPSTVTRIPALVDIAKANLIIDEGLELTNVVDLARRFAAAPAHVEYLTLPATPATIGRAEVLRVDERAAAPVRERLATLGQAAPEAGPAAPGQADDVTNGAAPAPVTTPTPAPGATPSVPVC